jgi:uncharacterized protein (UPF0371 family)
VSDGRGRDSRRDGGGTEGESVVEVAGAASRTDKTVANEGRKDERRISLTREARLTTAAGSGHGNLLETISRAFKESNIRSVKKFPRVTPGPSGCGPG